MSKLKLMVVFMAFASLLSAASCGNKLDNRIKRAWGAAYRMNVSTDSDPQDMMEGIYAFGSRYNIVNAVTQKKEQALSYLTSGVITGLVKIDAKGPYFADRIGDRIGEQHRNQFIADLLSTDADINTSFIADNGRTFQINDFANRQMIVLDPETLAMEKKLITGPDGNELGWTNIAFSKGKLLATTWPNDKGKNVSVADLVQVSLGRPVEWGSYSGLIEQLGIAVALREYEKYRLTEEMAVFEANKKRGEAVSKPTLDSIELGGVWLKARSHVRKVVDLMKKNQNRDGSFSSHWHEKKVPPENVEELILYTGHALDFLAVALNDRQLEEPWVRSAADRLSRTIISNRYQLDDKNWAVTHAAHALFAYKDRLKNKGNPIKPAYSKTRKCCD